MAHVSVARHVLLKSLCCFAAFTDLTQSYIFHCKPCILLLGYNNADLFLLSQSGFFFMESFVVEFDESSQTCFSFMHEHEALRFCISVCVWGCFLVSKKARGCIFCLLHLAFWQILHSHNFSLLVIMRKLMYISIEKKEAERK